MRPEFGVVVPPKDFRGEIERLLDEHSLRSKMSLAARSFAASHPFSDQAAALASILSSM